MALQVGPLRTALSWFGAELTLDGWLGSEFGSSSPVAGRTALASTHTLTTAGTAGRSALAALSAGKHTLRDVNYPNILLDADMLLLTKTTLNSTQDRTVQAYFSGPFRLNPTGGQTGGPIIEVVTNSAVNPQGVIINPRLYSGSGYLWDQIDRFDPATTSVTLSVWVKTSAPQNLSLGTRWTLPAGNARAETSTLKASTTSWQRISTTIGPGAPNSEGTYPSIQIRLMDGYVASGITISIEKPMVEYSTTLNPWVSGTTVTSGVVVDRPAIPTLTSTHSLTASASVDGYVQAALTSTHTLTASVVVDMPVQAALASTHSLTTAVTVSTPATGAAVLTLTAAATVALSYPVNAPASLALTGAATVGLRFGSTGSGSIVLTATGAAGLRFASNGSGALTLTGVATGSLRFPVAGSAGITVTAVGTGPVWSVATARFGLTAVAHTGWGSFTPPVHKYHPVAKFPGITYREGGNIYKRNGVWGVVNSPSALFISQCSAFYVGGVSTNVEPDAGADLIAAGYVVTQF